MALCQEFWTQEQGSRIAASGPLNYEFAMFRLLEEKFCRRFDRAVSPELLT